MGSDVSAAQIHRLRWFMTKGVMEQVGVGRHGARGSQTVLDDTAVLRVAFVRSPYLRARSAWADKIGGVQCRGSATQTMFKRLVDAAGWKWAHFQNGERCPSWEETAEMLSHAARDQRWAKLREVEFNDYY